ncbi:MAG: HlyD family type I secretion periplasmic adaptor subunit [Pseudomonadota bacterium]
MSAPTTKERDPWNPRSYVATGIITLVLLVGGVGGWSALAELAGAVITSGELRKESNRQVVEHPEGGIVAEILVKDGDDVAAGDVLLRLDKTRPRAELAIIDVQLDEAMTTIARLTAERDGERSMPLPAELRDRLIGDADLTSVASGQRKLFQARLESIEAERAQLSSRIEQIKIRIDGSAQQIEALKLQSDLIAEEVTAQQALFEKGLATAAPLSALKRESARLEGETAGLQAAIAEAESEIAATRVALLQLDGNRREEAINGLRSLHAEVAELKQQRIAIADRLARMDVRAPRSGIVHALAVHARESVIQSAEPLLYIVPEDEALIVAVEVTPNEIDSVHLGQEVDVRFPAFNAHTTPSISGHVHTISADRRVDDQSGESFYAVEISLDEPELDEAINKAELLPGMPVEAYLRTEVRTPISYLTKPLTDQIARAMRED